MALTKKHNYTVVVIGTGFGATMNAITLAEEFTNRNQNQAQAPSETILMLERGTWWTTPISTVQDKEIETADFIAKQGQPVQYWSSQNYFRGFLDIFSRCFRRTKDENIFTRLFKSLRNEDGLYDFTIMGTRGFLGLFGRKTDGVSVLRASGVGGGSLIYSNITIQPPDFVLNDERWPTSWTKDERDGFYNLARHAISFGVRSALRAGDGHIPFLGAKMPDEAVNAGLSNIVARTARLKPHWDVVADPNNPANPRGIKRYHENPKAPKLPDPNAPAVPDRANGLWLDRARVFQTASKDLTSDYGAVDLAINDLTPEDSMLGVDPNGVPNDNLPHDFPLEKSVNYCERQGRCNVGCLPGARHTLNKQLMAAAFGKFNDPKPTYQNLKIEALCEVDVVRALPEGGYEVQYLKRHHDDPSSFDKMTVTADMVIVSAGCLGTNEIMLRSKERGTLPNLSDKVGVGFSANGDYLAFLEKTRERASLVRGPVTTSFAHFNSDQAGTGPESARDNPDPALFHTIEDQGIPPALASVVGQGLPLIQRLVDKGAGGGFLIRAILGHLKKRVPQLIREIWRNNRERADFFKSEEERVSNMFAVICMGRDSAEGVFRLGKRGETALRVSRPGNRKFRDDLIYGAIVKSLERLAKKLRPDGTTFEFSNPFLTKTAKAAGAQSVASAHPMGGCRMAKSVADGVVDEFGRVFDKTKTGPLPFYQGLYIADASIIPTALGVNPSLTISALSLRVAQHIIAELPPVPTSLG
jgi:choline dehydrogenase-like flavoprotein